MDYIMVWYERIPYSNGLTHGINLLNFYPYLSNLTVKLFHVLLIQLFKYEICKKNKRGKEIHSYSSTTIDVFFQISDYVHVVT